MSVIQININGTKLSAKMYRFGDEIKKWKSYQTLFVRVIFKT